MPTYTAPYGQMYLPMSSDWIPTLSQVVLEVGCYAEIWSGLQLPSSEIENELLLGNIPIVAGTVTIDRGNTIRRTASNVTLLPGFSAMLLPLVSQPQTNTSNIYAPFSAEMRIYKGINEGTEADPSWEYACLGIFQISEVDVVDDSTGCTLVGTMKDRAAWVQQRTFQFPYATDGLSATDTAIVDLLDAAAGYGTLPYTFNIPSIPFVPAVTTYDVNDDPWQGACDLASTAGYQLYFDYDGVLQATPIPDPNDGSICIEYFEGSTPSAVTLKRVLSNDAVPNIICVQSQGSYAATQYQCWWWDDDPYSPTFFAPSTTRGGGSDANPGPTLPTQSAAARYPATIQLVTTSQIPSSGQVAACDNLATKTSLLRVGAWENTAMEVRENAAHDVDDIILVQRVTSGVYIIEDDENTPATYVVDQVTIDLGATKPLSLTMRPVSLYG
jgi:hypothetical protein